MSEVQNGQCGDDFGKRREFALNPGKVLENPLGEAGMDGDAKVCWHGCCTIAIAELFGN